MPFFDRNRLIITCDFDDNIVVVGGSISGTVNIFVLEQVTLCGAALRYHVDESYLIHTDERHAKAHVDKTSFNIEYVLFGNRSTKKSAPIVVQPGHYKYPFVIPVPANCPPSTAYSSNKAVQRIKGESITVRVDHRVDVNVYIANSLMDKQSTYTVPMIVKCTSPSLLTATTNGREAHLRKGMSTTFSNKNSLIMQMLAKSFSSVTAEQADCDLFVYNVAVSLAETPFLHFAIRGTINCPYLVSLIRVTSYGNGFNKKATEEVVSTVTMPPLDSPDAGVRGKLIISPHALGSSTSFSGKFVECKFFVTLKLIYKSGVDAGIKEENRVCLPVDVSHGSLSVEAVPGVVAETISDGAVMGYTCPEGHHGEHVPIGPVTENVAPAAWGGSQMKYNRQEIMHQTPQGGAGGPGERAAVNAALLVPSESIMIRGLDGQIRPADAPAFASNGNAYAAPTEYTEESAGAVFDELGEDSKGPASLPPQTA
eukprot:GILI01001358.1.p1 GENE.GILI01001358.1~~GILI01001358.1.p1  ORF type:complete len:497 (-),score=133.35 GILI01001358.1:284-1729(-)